ncbi:hypothetical protein BFP70_00445 [Thioclava sp. SK-1]|nr:hypothetical protein BFP70_00445 [Thioclava sp. SK-1]
MHPFVLSAARRRLRVGAWLGVLVRDCRNRRLDLHQIFVGGAGLINLFGLTSVNVPSGGAA